MNFNAKQRKQADKLVFKKLISRNKEDELIQFRELIEKEKTNSLTESERKVLYHYRYDSLVK